MTAHDDVILEFISFLARTRSLIRELHIFSEKQKTLRQASTSVNHFVGKESGDYADHGVTIEMSVNADISTPTNSERTAIGASLLLRHNSGAWIAEAEVGYSGQSIGWDPIDSREIIESDIAAIMKGTPALIEWMEQLYRNEINKLT